MDTDTAASLVADLVTEVQNQHQKVAAAGVVAERDALRAKVEELRTQRDQARKLLGAEASEGLLQAVQRVVRCRNEVQDELRRRAGVPTAEPQPPLQLQLAMRICRVLHSPDHQEDVVLALPGEHFELADHPCGKLATRVTIKDDRGQAGSKPITISGNLWSLSRGYFQRFTISRDWDHATFEWCQIDELGDCPRGRWVVS